MKKINSNPNSILMVLVFLICIPFVGQTQTMIATSGSLNLENSHHIMSGISLRQELPGVLSLDISRIGGKIGMESLRMSSSSFRITPWTWRTSRVRPWIAGGICYSTLTPPDLAPDVGDKQPAPEVFDSRKSGITIPIGVGMDFCISDRLNTSISATTFLGNTDVFRHTQEEIETKTARTDAVIAVLQVGLAFKIVKSITKKKAQINYLEEDTSPFLGPLSPVLFVDMRGGVVTEDEWNHLFPSLGDPDTYAIDHQVVVAQYSKADYQKMADASQNKIEMYEKEAVEQVNASILYHMLHDNQNEKTTNKKLNKKQNKKTEKEDK